MTEKHKKELLFPQAHIDLLAKQKELYLVQFFSLEISRLPLLLREKVVEAKLIEVNQQIIDLHIKHNLSLPNVFTENDELQYQDFNCEDVIIVLPTKSFSKYFNLNLTIEEGDLLHKWLTSDSQLSDCPANAKQFISDLIDYLAYLTFYILLLELQFNKEYSNNKIKLLMSNPNQLQTKLTDIQRGKLFDLLVESGFIPDKDKEGFIWAFGGKNGNYTSYSTRWLNQKNLAVYLIDTLSIDKGRLWAIGSRIFSINNMAQIKENYFSTNKTGKPKRYELIDKIISEAQK